MSLRAEVPNQVRVPQMGKPGRQRSLGKGRGLGRKAAEADEARGPACTALQGSHYMHEHTVEGSRHVF